eukprot:6491880-Amphidinium_carterae.1
MGDMGVYFSPIPRFCRTEGKSAAYKALKTGAERAAFKAEWAERVKNGSVAKQACKRQSQEQKAGKK